MGNHEDSSAIWNIREAQLPLYYKHPFWNRRIQSVPSFIWPAFVEKREKKQVFTSHFVNETDWGPLHMSPVDQAGLVLFLRKTKKTLDFPVCCRLLKCPTPLHFLPSLVPVSDLLAALYNLCFFLHSLLWALLSQGRLQRLDEILMEIFLSIVDLMLFPVHFIYGLLMSLSVLICKTLKTTSHHLSSCQWLSFLPGEDFRFG